jgi:hypothetical protein
MWSSPPVVEHPIKVAFMLVTALLEHRVSVDVGVVWTFCVTPSLDEGVLKDLRIGLLVLSLPVVDMTLSIEEMGQLDD